MTDERQARPAADPHDEVATPRNVAPFRTALVWAVAAWVMGAFLVLACCIYFPAISRDDSRAIATITLGSLLIACGSMWAGTILTRTWSTSLVRGGAEANAASATSLLAAAVSGMFLRLVGTVALFLTCRYHMAASAGVIVSMTVGWYVFLTSVEMAALARELKRIDLIPVHEGPVAAIHHQTLNARP